MIISNTHPASAANYKEYIIRSIVFSCNASDDIAATAVISQYANGSPLSSFEVLRLNAASLSAQDAQFASAFDACIAEIRRQAINYAKI